VSVPPVLLFPLYLLNQLTFDLNVYRAMLCIRGTSHGPVSVSVSVSVKSRCSIETDGRIKVVFWRVNFLPPVLHCVKRKFGYLQNKGTSLWNFVLNSGLENFATAYRSSKRVINLARERWTLRA